MLNQKMEPAMMNIARRMFAGAKVLRQPTLYPYTSAASFVAADLVQQTFKFMLRMAIKLLSVRLTKGFGQGEIVKIIEWITGAYETLFSVFENIISFIWDGGEAAKNFVMTICSVLVIFGFESIYFNYAQDVRLLFVIIIAVAGAIFGALLGYMAGIFILFLISSIIILAGIATVLIPIAMLIYILYNVIVWTN